MSVTIYDASIPMLENCARMLGKAEAQAAGLGLEPATLLRARLHPDMFPLARQVRIAIDGARGAAARLAGIEIPDPEAAEYAVFDRGFDHDFGPDAETFTELGVRLAAALAFLRSVPPQALDAAETRTIELTRRGSTRRFTALPFLLSYALPNFYFHLAIAHGILRHHGIEIGKADYEGPLVYEVIGASQDREPVV